MAAGEIGLVSVIESVGAKGAKGYFELDPNGIVVYDFDLLNHGNGETQRNLHLWIKYSIKGELGNLGIKGSPITKLDTFRRERV